MVINKAVGVRDHPPKHAGGHRVLDHFSEAGNRADGNRHVVEDHGRLRTVSVPSNKRTHGFIECITNVFGVSHYSLSWGASKLRLPAAVRSATTMTVIHQSGPSPSSRRQSYGAISSTSRT